MSINQNSKQKKEKNIQSNEIIEQIDNDTQNLFNKSDEIDSIKLNQPFPIVGIGASAGGLSAFEAFFSAMPTDINPDMAFILVQHLAPDH